MALAEDLKPILFLTNRFNLLEILSSLLITSRFGFAKYYDDFLEMAPGRIPLFQAPLSSGLSEFVGKNVDAFSVAIEVDPAALDQVSIPALAREGTTNSIPLQSGFARMWAAGGVIPPTAIKRVHFRSRKNLEEHTLREYENVHAGWPTFVISPELFSGGSLEVGEAKEWLRSLDRTDQPSVDDLSLVDRLAGARCLAAFATPAESVGGLGGFLTGRTPTTRPDAFPSWLTRENSIGERGAHWRDKTLDERLYSCAVGVLRTVKPADSWRPLVIVDELQSTVSTMQLTKKDAAQVQRQLTAIRGILRNEKELRPFRRGLGSPVLKGLLMTLMRPDPARLFSWPAGESGADHEVMIAAAAFVGVLQGRRRLSTEYRPLALDRFLSLMSAQEATNGLSNVLGPPREIPTLSVTRPGSTNTTVQITWGEEVLVKKESRNHRMVGVLRNLDLHNSAVVSVLSRFCVERDWKNCVRSVVSTTERNWNTAPRSGGPGLEIIVLGPVTVRVEIVEEALREKLRDISLSPDEEEDLARKLLAASSVVERRRDGSDPN